MIAPHGLQQMLSALPRGPFRSADAVRAGIPPSALDALVATGALRRPLQGVLLPSTIPETLQSRAEAARLVLPEGAALCRITAAWLLGIDARPPGTHADDPPLECAVPLGTTPVRRPGIRYYVTDLTGLGLGTLDSMTRAGLVDPAELLPMVERWRGDRHVAQARVLIQIVDPRSESVGESCLRLRFHDAGFPPPELQISLTDEYGRELRRLDLGYREKRWALEYDGEKYHAGRAAETADRLRRNEIDQRWGWTVVGVGKSLVFGPSMAIEYAIGEIVGMEPLIRRRQW